MLFQKTTLEKLLLEGRYAPTYLTLKAAAALDGVGSSFWHVVDALSFGHNSSAVAISSKTIIGAARRTPVPFPPPTSVLRLSKPASAAVDYATITGVIPITVIDSSSTSNAAPQDDGLIEYLRQVLQPPAMSYTGLGVLLLFLWVLAATYYILHTHVNSKHRRMSQQTTTDVQGFRDAKMNKKLDDFELRLGSIRQENSQQVNTVTTDNQNLRTGLKTLTGTITDLQTVNKGLRKEFWRLQDQHDKEKDSRVVLNNQNEALTAEHTTLSKKLNSNKDELVGLFKKHKVLLSGFDALETKYTLLEAQHISVKKELGAEKEHVKGLIHKLELTKSDGEKKAGDLLVLQNTVDTLRGQSDSAKKAGTRIESQIEANKKEVDVSIQSLQIAAAKHTTTVKEINGKIGQLQMTSTIHTASVKEINGKVRELQTTSAVHSAGLKTSEIKVENMSNAVRDTAKEVEERLNDQAETIDGQDELLASVKEQLNNLDESLAREISRIDDSLDAASAQLSDIDMAHDNSEEEIRDLVAEVDKKAESKQDSLVTRLVAIDIEIDKYVDTNNTLAARVGTVEDELHGAIADSQKVRLDTGAEIQNLEQTSSIDKTSNELRMSIVEGNIKSLWGDIKAHANDLESKMKVLREQGLVIEGQTRRLHGFQLHQSRPSSQPPKEKRTHRAGAREAEKKGTRKKVAAETESLETQAEGEASVKEALLTAMENMLAVTVHAPLSMVAPFIHMQPPVASSAVAKDVTPYADPDFDVEETSNSSVVSGSIDGGCENIGALGHRNDETSGPDNKISDMFSQGGKTLTFTSPSASPNGDTHDPDTKVSASTDDEKELLAATGSSEHKLRDQDGEPSKPTERTSKSVNIASRSEVTFEEALETIDRNEEAAIAGFCPGDTSVGTSGATNHSEEIEDTASDLEDTRDEAAEIAGHDGDVVVLDPVIKRRRYFNIPVNNLTGRILPPSRLGAGYNELTAKKRRAHNAHVKDWEQQVEADLAASKQSDQSKCTPADGSLDPFVKSFHPGAGGPVLKEVKKKKSQPNQPGTPITNPDRRQTESRRRHGAERQARYYAQQNVGPPSAATRGPIARVNHHVGNSSYDAQNRHYPSPPVQPQYGKQQDGGLVQPALAHQDFVQQGIGAYHRQPLPPFQAAYSGPMNSISANSTGYFDNPPQHPTYNQSRTY